MKIINIISWSIITAIALFFLSFKVLLVKIDIGEVGVRTMQYSFLGAKKGVEERDFQPGWHRKIPMIDTWRIFDSTVQTTEFTTAQERRQSNEVFNLFNSRGLLNENFSKNYPTAGPDQIELKSKDGYTVKLDVTVKFRIQSGHAHLIYQKFNTEEQYKRIVRDQVQNTIRNVFGTMRTEEFYDPVVRRQKTNMTYKTLSEDLNNNHVELINILIRDITFDPSYERKILDKKLADQDVELNKSKAVAEEKKGLTNKIIAETEAKVQVIDEEKNGEQLRMRAETDRQIADINSQARLTVAKLNADADLYAAEKTAQGMLLERQAEAEGERLKAKALEGSGGANLVALEAVKGVNLEKIVISTLETDPLDVEAMIDKLGAAKE
jgi:regulator of protease activity HflC (stomatin/prohibitin superfamily)